MERAHPGRRASSRLASQQGARMISDTRELRLNPACRSSRTYAGQGARPPGWEMQKVHGLVSGMETPLDGRCLCRRRGSHLAGSPSRARGCRSHLRRAKTHRGRLELFRAGVLRYRSSAQIPIVRKRCTSAWTVSARKKGLHRRGSRRRRRALGDFPDRGDCAQF